MRALSLDLRQRILAAGQAGQTQSQIAQRFAVSQASVCRLLQQWGKTQNLTPKPRPGKRPLIPTEQLPQFDALVASRTDWTLTALADAWKQQTGVRLGISTLHRILKQRRFTHKKSDALPANATPTNALPSERP